MDLYQSHFLIAGLGNPGTEYTSTRHNIGRIVLDLLLDALGIEKKRHIDNKYHGSIVHYTFVITSENKSLFGRSIPLGSYKLIIVKPSTFMNLSGSCLQPLMQFYKIPPSHLLVIHDDLDQPLGSYKYKKKGSSGGQNGIKHIIQKLGTDEFYRLKVGIGRPDHSEYDIVRWVLSKVDDHEIEHIKKLIPSFIHSIGLFLQGKV